MQIAPTGFPGRPRTYRDFGRNRPSLGSILGFIPTKLTRQIVGPQDHSSFTVNISFQLATSLERRQLRKPFCASPALARFHTAWTQRRHYAYPGGRSPWYDDLSVSFSASIRLDIVVRIDPARRPTAPRGPSRRSIRRAETGG